MKKTTLFLVFISLIVKSQIKSDTIEVEYNNIKKITETMDSNPKVKPTVFERYYDNKSMPLNGLYKVIVGSDNYYITSFRNGIEDVSYFNLKKYYSQEKLIKIDLKDRAIMGSSYLSIFDYDCDKSS